MKHSDGDSVFGFWTSKLVIVLIAILITLILMIPCVTLADRHNMKQYIHCTHNIVGDFHIKTVILLKKMLGSAVVMS